jgi:hypothetical protein
VAAGWIAPGQVAWLYIMEKIADTIRIRLPRGHNHREL